MKIRNQFLKTIPLALVLACFGAVTNAQELSEQDLPTLSPATYGGVSRSDVWGLCRTPLGPRLPFA
jgi:hypothetical protein